MHTCIHGMILMIYCYSCHQRPGGVDASDPWINEFQRSIANRHTGNFDSRRANWNWTVSLEAGSEYFARRCENRKDILPNVE